MSPVSDLSVRFFTALAALQLIHSSPTRRSSDLVVAPLERRLAERSASAPLMLYACGPEPMLAAVARASARRPRASRSEEHTSELQSRFDLVCRLLLEKKNNNKEIMSKVTEQSIR